MLKIDFISIRKINRNALTKKETLKQKIERAREREREILGQDFKFETSDT